MNFVAGSGNIRHQLVREVATRLGRRYVARCGASAYVLKNVPDGPVTCIRCRKNLLFTLEPRASLSSKET